MSHFIQIPKIVLLGLLYVVAAIVCGDPRLPHSSVLASGALSTAYELTGDPDLCSIWQNSGITNPGMVHFER